MNSHRFILALFLAMLLGLSGCMGEGAYQGQSGTSSSTGNGGGGY